MNFVDRHLFRNHSLRLDPRTNHPWNPRNSQRAAGHNPHPEARVLLLIICTRRITRTSNITRLCSNSCCHNYLKRNACSWINHRPNRVAPHIDLPFSQSWWSPRTHINNGANLVSRKSILIRGQNPVAFIMNE